MQDQFHPSSPPLSSLSFLTSGFCLCLEKKFLDLLCGWTCLWVCVCVYDRYHVFMGLIFWVWEIGTHVFLFLFLFDKVNHVFMWRRKERKRTKKKKKNGRWSESVKKKERKKKKEEKEEEEKGRWVSQWRRKERKSKEEKKKEKRKRKDVTSLWPWVPQMYVYLPKCHHNSVSITQKHPKVVFSFANSSLKNQRIKWWKQNLKTQPNRLPLHGTHQFWVMGDKNLQIQTAS